MTLCRQLVQQLRQGFAFILAEFRVKEAVDFVQGARVTLLEYRLA